MLVISIIMLKTSLRPSNLNPSLHWILVPHSHPRFCCDQGLQPSYILLLQQASQGMEAPVPKGTSAPVGPASHSPVMQAPTAPCLARLPASPAPLAITALRTSRATVDTHVPLASTAPEVGALDRAPWIRLPARGSKGPLGSAHSTVLSAPVPCGKGASGSQETLPIPKLCFSGTKHATQFPCPRGYYNPDPLTHSLDSCLPCPPGHYCGQENLTKPSGACDAGMFSHVGPDKPLLISVLPISPLSLGSPELASRSATGMVGPCSPQNSAHSILPLLPRLVLCVSGMDCSPL